MDEVTKWGKMQSNGEHGMINDHNGPETETKLTPQPCEDRGKIVRSHAANVFHVE